MRCFTAAMRAGVGCGERHEVVGHAVDLVAVAHPDLRFVGHAGEQIVGVAASSIVQLRPADTRGPVRSARLPPSAWHISCMP